MEKEKNFQRYCPASVPQDATFCVYVCAIIIHIICECHAEARRIAGGGGDSLQLKNGKKWVGYLHPLYIKISKSHYFLKQLHNISN